MPVTDLSDEQARLYNGYSREGVECWSCHDGAGTGTAKGPNLFVRVPRQSRAVLIESILKGVGRMPDHAGVLTPDETAALVDWLKRTFRRNE